MSYIRLYNTILKKEKIMRISIVSESSSFNSNINKYIIYITYAKIYEKDGHVNTYITIPLKYKPLQLLIEDLNILLASNLNCKIDNNVEELKETINKFLSQNTK